ncbi:hypothetical protein QRX25_09600 [Bacillus sp. L381]|uniref:hypothetical protein n=1 Tax=Bacillus TaxID=1386 RepID=UPI001CA3C845|nr:MULTISPECIES: hypothetical protein [Bacillus]QZY10030.1 hypothetical protein K7B13_09535 [Bacillus amyloliquefaciens]WIX19930.1 hypothetical protein QRX25_09600 [Bacillus sp. L381]
MKNGKITETASGRTAAVLYSGDITGQVSASGALCKELLWEIIIQSNEVRGIE